jgi:hypothetical protein
MAQTDTRNFLTDLLIRWDPNLDLSEGSRALSDLIEPILARIGGDPFDQDIETFIRTRLQQVRPDLAITEADELTDLLIDPMRVLLEPISREIQLVKLRTSLNNVEALADDEVDALLGNFFEARKAGGYAVGTVRVYFAAPQSVSVTLVHIAQSKSGLRFVVPRPQSITADQMLLNIEGTEYYWDVAYVAEARGSEYNVERGDINSISNLASAIRVINLRRFTEGVARETSSEYVARVQQGTSDKTLTTAPGISAVLSESFPGLRHLYEIGYGDPEMKRDVLEGGGLGAVPDNDSLGSFYGLGTPVDDLDADSTSPLLEAAGGNFIARVAAVGATVDGWYLTITYQSGGLIVKDTPIVEVLSDSRVRITEEMPLSLGPNAVTWMLRARRLTVSSVPGGIVLPDTPQGALTLPAGQVHVGGKTDVFVAGDVEQGTAQVLGMTDEKPLARGVLAQTNASDVVALPDISAAALLAAQPGMSLVLSEGADVGAYRIVQVLQSPARVRLDMVLTGTQSNLLWKIVDEIDLDLMAPKDVLLEGTDLVLSGGSGVVITSGGTNFSAAGVQPDDVLYVDHVDYGGDYRVTDVNAFSVTVDPPAPRSLSGLRYVLSRRSEGVDPPVLRVRSLELLDSAGSPNGTVIPYRDPVMVRSKSFQNEGAGFLYDGPAFLGLASVNGWVGAAPLGGATITWSARDPGRAWQAPTSSGSFTFAANGSVQQLVDKLNANATLRNAGIRGVVLHYAGRDHIGLSSQRLVTITGGSALPLLGWEVGQTNAMVRGAQSLAYVKVRRGDLVECVGGNNGGFGARVVADPTAQADRVILGTGPLGPAGTSGLYDNALLNPDAGGRIRVGRPSVGSVRCYFLEPTSIEFNYATTRLTTTFNGLTRVYRPDPENTRVMIPPAPRTTLPSTGVIAEAAVLRDDNANFLLAGVREGDLLDVLYRPIVGDTDLSSTSTIAVGGQSLFVQLDNDPFIEVGFPYAMARDDVVKYINAQVGSALASIVGDRLVLKSSRRLALSAGSTALYTLGLNTLTTDHPSQGTYVVRTVDTHTINITNNAAFGTVGTTDTHYRVRRYLQRVSSTEMNAQQDSSGLYYADVEAISMFPGEAYNIAADVELDISGYKSDGYRLTTVNPALSFSRAEELRAEVSRTILLVGGTDDPADYVQLNLQNVQVSYDRSQLADDVQSFVSSRYRRVLCEDILVRHLFPHYVSLNWRYAGGATEVEMLRVIQDLLAKVRGGETLEVGSLVGLLRGKQASSVYAVDPNAPNGRTAPQLLVVRHDEDRKVRASLVRDIVDTVRMATYFPDQLTLRRLSAAGLR